MKITPIGIYGSYPAAFGATGCYLVESENAKIVLDLGCGAFSRLRGFVDPSLVDAFILSRQACNILSGYARGQILSDKERKHA